MENFNLVGNLISGVYVFKNTSNGVYRVGYVRDSCLSVSEIMTLQEEEEAWLLPNTLKCVAFIETQRPEIMEKVVCACLEEYRCHPYKNLFKF